MTSPLDDRARAMVEVAREITASLDLRAVLERIVEQASLLLGSPRIALAVLDGMDGDRPVIRFVASRGMSQRFTVMRPLGRRDGTTPTAILERRPVWSADILNDPAFDLAPSTRRIVEAEGYRAVLSVPLLAGPRTLGAVVLYRDAPGPFSDAEVELLGVFAAQAGVAIENAELYRRAEVRVAKLTALGALTRLMTSAASGRQVFDAVAEAAARLLDAAIARVWVHDPARGTLDVQGSFALDRALVDARFITSLPCDSGLPGQIFGERRPVYLRDVQDDPRWIDAELAREAGLHGFAGVPLIRGDVVVGVLALIFTGARDLDDEDRDLLGLLAGQAAIAIGQSQLYAEAERRRREAEVLAELARTINGSLDLDTVLERVVAGARDLCDADFARIALRAPGDEAATLRYGLGVRAQGWRGFRVEPGKGTGGQVLATGRPFRTDDYQADPRFTKDYAALARDEGGVAELVAPIRSGDAIQGLLYVTRRTARRFTDRDEAVLTRLADHAGTAINNANLYQELRRANEDLARSQAHLVKNERLRALGEMAAGVAHDFNNLLAVILGRADIVLRRLADPGLRASVECIRQSARDGADTVRRIQEFTRTRAVRELDRVDVSEVLRQVAELTRPRWEDEAQSRGVHYEVCVCATGPAPVRGRPEALREVFTNLLVNALDAMPEGGRCELSAAVRDDRVEASVTDTGAGMSDEVRRRIFEPFFTTKGPRGTGLGLAMVWGIVTRHGGTIDVASAPGQGSRFTVRLPLHTGAVAPPPEAPAPPSFAPARILVVDDDPEVRAVLVAMLEEGGHRIAEADSGADALCRLEADPCDLIISDLSMPQMSGWELAAACHERHPTLPFGLITGWGDQLDREELARRHVRFVIAKPFEAADVLRQVSEVMALPARG